MTHATEQKKIIREQRTARRRGREEPMLPGPTLSDHFARIADLQHALGNQRVGRMIQPDRKDESALPKVTGGMPPVVQSVLAEEGRPLEEGLRAQMESRYGMDFSQVRIHTDARAAQSAAAVQADAYTAGRDVVFGEGRYAPQNGEGRRLLAHELAHVVQQSRGGTAPPLDPEASQERDADQASAAVAAGRSAARVQSGTGVGLARQAQGSSRGGTILEIQVTSDMNRNDVRRKVSALNDLASRGKLERAASPLPPRKVVPEGTAAREYQVPVPSVAAEYKYKVLDQAHKQIGRNSPNYDPVRWQKFWNLWKSTQGDHVHELQLSGPDVEDNIWLLDASTNEEIGRQIAVQLRKVPPGTKIVEVRIKSGGTPAPVSAPSTPSPPAAAAVTKQEPPTAPAPAVKSSSELPSPAPPKPVTTPGTSPAPSVAASTNTEPMSPAGKQPTPRPKPSAPSAQREGTGGPAPLVGSEGQRVFRGKPPESSAVELPSSPKGEQGKAAAEGAVVAVNLLRAGLEDIADQDARDEAETWLVQKRPWIYQQLFENPGKGMVVEFHFEPSGGSLQFKGATPTMVTERSGASQRISVDTSGTGATLYFPPTRKATPTKPAVSGTAPPVKAVEVDSPERLIGMFPKPGDYVSVYGTLKEAMASQGFSGRYQLDLDGTSISISANAFSQVLNVYRNMAVERLNERLKQLDDYIAASDVHLREALTAHSNFVSKWWHRKRIALLDPHVLDQPHAHAAAARDAIQREDFRNASASLKAGRELVDLAEERIHQFWTGIDRIEEERL